ncbi:inorganic phosphate transporter [Streptomyces antibioticus]|uniref:Protein transporter Sec31 n=1 Tax=Streptomyces antibioticus TaxID=1890 RepID=A0AAE7CND0_STRAT|nr:hypothetical protein [Streptomyces antibioticus]OOQ47292.1 hypothetical protein AFM16_31625 [Streptomyces antibioticus]QIT47616.1 hypothetical protein HCX60_32180 [Streptomyces antibioticus]
MNSPTVRPVTRNGRTHYVEEPAKLPPLTPDELIMRGVGAATAVVVIGALIWSTVSVGGMLDMVAPAWASYMIAGVFDLAWIVAMAIEYVLRFEPRRQKVPKAIGWLALVTSMAAIFAHGALLDKPWIGAFGALVSALAKGLWWLLMFATSRRLDNDTQAWLTLELGEIHARRAEQNALAKVQREREKYALEQPADTVHTVVQDSPDVVSGRPSATPDVALDASTPKPVTSEDSRPDPLRTIADQASGPSDLVRTLAGHIHPDTLVDTAVRLRPDLKADSIRRTAKRLGNTYL